MLPSRRLTSGQSGFLKTGRTLHACDASASPVHTFFIVQIEPALALAAVFEERRAVHDPEINAFLSKSMASLRNLKILGELATDRAEGSRR